MHTAATAWLFAVHISDSVLSPSWLCGGFLVAAGLVAIGAWRIRDEEIPPIALLTAAFFVASQIHVRVGPTSAHLLLNGLLGVVLGRRVCLAIPVGLFLQAVLTGHGGFSTLGVNSCVMVIPALLAAGLFGLLRRAPWLGQPAVRSAVTFFSLAFWGLSVAFAVSLLVAGRGVHADELEAMSGRHIAFHPLSVTSVLLLATVGTWLERRIEAAPEFPVGLLIGTATVLLTLVLNGVVLICGGAEDWRSFALITFVAHVPVAIVESVVLGFAVGFLARVKPDLIDWRPAEKTECPADALT